MTAAERRTAISAVRGVQLALHAAAGLVQGLDLEAVRLLRVCEGLSRAAAGRLESLSRVAAASGSAVACDKNAERVEKQGAGKGKARKRKKSNKKDKLEGEMLVDPGQAGLTGASAAGGLVLGDDRWADAASVGPTPASPLRTTLAPGAAPAARPEPRRASRSPRRSPGLSSDLGAFVVGRFAMLLSLESRPDLDQTPVKILGLDASAGRVAVEAYTGERMRVKAAKLQPLPDAEDQALALEAFTSEDS